MLIDWPNPRIRSRKAKMVVLTVRDASLLSNQRINEKVIKPIHLQLVPELSIGLFVKAVDFYTKNRMYFGIGKRKRANGTASSLNFILKVLAQQEQG